MRIADPTRKHPHRSADGAAVPTALGAARKVAVAAAGTAVLAIGVALIVLPGPAILVIPAGLAILATEFPWARRVLRQGKDRVRRLLGRRHRAAAASNRRRARSAR